MCFNKVKFTVSVVGQGKEYKIDNLIAAHKYNHAVISKLPHCSADKIIIYIIIIKSLTFKMSDHSRGQKVVFLMLHSPQASLGKSVVVVLQKQTIWKDKGQN